jgi:radical SAM superfamily enzyme YgiQ (UPF0313 family)
MRVLLLKPRNAELHFGLAPFFRTEPLGLEYIAAELTARGHQVRVIDLGFDGRSLPRIIRFFSPELVGISCLHILDVAATLRLTAEIKQIDPSIFIAVGGHSVVSYPVALEHSRGVDAICLGQGKSSMPAFCDAMARRTALEEIPSVLFRRRRTILNAAGRKKWRQWRPQVDLRHIGHMARILSRSQKLMDPRAYLAEFHTPADSD